MAKCPPLPVEGEQQQVSREADVVDAVARRRTRLPSESLSQEKYRTTFP
jgi:hypothetical protein